MDQLSGYSIPEFMTQIDQMPARQDDRVYTPSFEEMTSSVFFNRMNNLDKLEEKDRFNFLKANIDVISNQIIDGTCKYFKKLLEPVFLRTYKQLLSTMPGTVTRTMAANKLAYSYRFMKSHDTNTMKIFLEIARVVNYSSIRLLKSVGLNDDVACNLAIARFSSADEMVNVNRLNYEIYSTGSAIMTEQTIIWIYEQLFDQVRYLFSATMMETKETMIPSPDMSEEDFYECFSQTSLALLTLINNMSMDSIDMLLHIFMEQWTTVGRPRTRFSLRALSADFGRIRHVVEVLEKEEKIFVP